MSSISFQSSVRIGLHYSGPLLEWIESAHPEYFERLRTLVKSGQVELVGGGFYEPVLVAIPLRDRTEQIKRLADYIEKRFETRPTGAWLTERVWEPQIPSSLAPAGIGSSDVEKVIFEILEISERELRKASLDDLRRGMAASIACRAAIKINMRLEPAKMDWLLRALASTSSPS